VPDPLRIVAVSIAKGAAADPARLLGKRADGLQGADAHELRDVLAVTAFNATDHRSQRIPER
jgi:hypothetical protein